MQFICSRSNNMIERLTIKKGFELFLILLVLFYSDVYLHAQNQLDEKFTEDVSKWYDMIYQVPKGYYGIEIESCYSANEYLQSTFHHSIKCEKHDVIAAFALISNKPDNSPRGVRIREVFGDPYKINRVVIANEADATLSEVKYLDTLQLKKINADRGVIYNLRILNKYKGIYAKCKKITIYKDNVGRSEILFFYNKGDDAVVDEEIKKTWGMLKFKA